MFLHKKSAMDKGEKGRQDYEKPLVTIYEIRLGTLLCLSPNNAFYLGGGGTYGDETTWNNGDDY